MLQDCAWCTAIDTLTRDVCGVMKWMVHGPCSGCRYVFPLFEKAAVCEFYAEVEGRVVVDQGQAGAAAAVLIQQGLELHAPSQHGT